MRMRAAVGFDYPFVYFHIWVSLLHICGLSGEWIREARLLLVFKTSSHLALSVPENSAL